MTKNSKVLDEICAISGKFTDHTSTIQFSVDKIKARLLEKEDQRLYSHEFLIDTKAFQILLDIHLDKPPAPENLTGLSIYLCPVARGTTETTSFSVNTNGNQTGDCSFTRQVFQGGDGAGFGWNNVLSLDQLEKLPNDTLIITATVTVHRKEEDHLETIR